MVSKFFSRAALAVALTGVAAAAFAACGSSDGSQEAEVLSSIDILDKAGLHGIDESINDKKEIPAGAGTTATHLQTVMELTDWPSDFEDEAGALGETFGQLAAAVEGESPDMAKAGQLAEKAHDDQHDFSQDVWAWLQEKAGIEVEENGDHGS